MQVREAAVSEAESLVRLINSAFLVERFFVDGDRLNLDEVLSCFQRGLFLVAEDAGELAACVYLEPRGERAYLGLLSVDPSRQGQGLGRLMMDAAEERCRRDGMRFLDLRIVNVRLELPPFYRRLGYVETGTDAFPAEVPTKLPCHFINMSKPL